MITEQQLEEWERLAENATNMAASRSIHSAGMALFALLSAYREQQAEIATHKALEVGMLRTAEQLADENILLKAGAEKLEEMIEQFHMGQAAYELGKEIDEKPVGDLYRIGYAWAAYYDQVIGMQKQQAALDAAREALEYVEWQVRPSGAWYCPWCGNMYSEHKPDCQRQSALAKLREEHP